MPGARDASVNGSQSSEPGFRHCNLTCSDDDCDDGDDDYDDDDGGDDLGGQGQRY